MPKTCPICHTTGIPDNATYCPTCSTQLPAAPPPSSPYYTQTSTSKNPKAWLIPLIIMEIVAGIVSVIGFWIVGLPLAIVAAYFAYTKGDNIVPRITVVIVALSLRGIQLIPENELISLFGLVIGISGVLLTSEINKKNKNKYLVISIFSALGIAAYSYFALFPGNLLVILIAAPPVMAVLVYKYPTEKAGMKLLGVMVCFAPILIAGINFLIVAGGAAFGGAMDKLQFGLTNGLGGSSTGTMLDMILNPKLAVSAGLKPASTTEVKKTTAPPSVAFTTSGSAIPTSGCYDTETFVITGSVKNTGGEYIKDLDLDVTPHTEGVALGSPCGEGFYNVSKPDGTVPCHYDVTSLSSDATRSETCTIKKISSPVILGIWEYAEGDAAPTHACFIDIKATTGYHSTSRLSVEFIESKYARIKLEQKQLTQSITPSITSQGPVELSLGGFNQPVLYYGDDDESKITLMTGLRKTGAGILSSSREDTAYYSIYMFVPTILLNSKGECASEETDDWDCVKIPDYESKGCRYPQTINEDNSCYKSLCSGLESAVSRFYCMNFLKYWIGTDNKIGTYKQFDYDNSNELLNDGYSICFFNDGVKDDGMIKTGSCTLEVKNAFINDEDKNALRKTLLIRGDVIYTYSIGSAVSVEVRDCNVEV